MGHEGVALDELFGTLPGGENSHRAFGRIAQRTGSEHDTTRMKFIEPCAMCRVVGLELDSASGAIS